MAAPADDGRYRMNGALCCIARMVSLRVHIHACRYFFFSCLYDAGARIFIEINWFPAGRQSGLLAAATGSCADVVDDKWRAEKFLING